nr:hypothetical protein [Eilatimonas milleporae]
MSLLKPSTRRRVLAGLAAGAGLFLPGMAFRIAADDVAPVSKRIPASGEGLPPVGLGSWTPSMSAMTLPRFGPAVM